MLEKEYIQLNNLSYHIQRKTIDTEAPTIIFLHDSLGSVQLWRDFPEQLSQALNCNYLIYDREGHGESSPFAITERAHHYLEMEAVVLHQIVQQLNLKQILLFGHSDGASIALWYAAKYPENVLVTIVEGVHVFVEEETLKGIRATKKALETSNLQERVAKYHGDKAPMLFKLWMETWLSPNYRDWNIEKDIQSITCPVLALQGENDEFGTMEQVHKIEKNIQGTFQSYFIENCGHSPHKEQKEFTLQRTIEFIISNT